MTLVGVTADRRWEEQADLLRKRGFDVVHAPTMRTIDLAGDPALRSVTESLMRTPPDWLVITTGAGFRSWLEACESWSRRDALVAALRDAGTRVVCRGAKGVSAVRGAGLDVAWRAERETMQEVVAYLQSAVAGDGGESVALQLFDPDDHWATQALRQLTPGLVEVPVYRWLLPEDTTPAEQLVAAVVAREVGAVTFTSQPAVRFLFALAERDGLDRALRDAFMADVLAVCVGPVCAEALEECGVTRTVWPDPPRLVPMVKLVEEHLAR